MKDYYIVKFAHTFNFNDFLKSRGNSGNGSVSCGSPALERDKISR